LVLTSGKPQTEGRKRWILYTLVCCIVGSGAGFAGLSMYPGGIDGYLSQYDFNAAIQEYGVIVSMVTEISGLGNQDDGMTLDFSEMQAAVPVDAVQSQENTSEATEEVKTYAPHMIPGLDFAQLAQNASDSTMRTLYSYIAAQTPALENEYTGLFKGKNLIFITAEAFNYTVIDPELTPTLYRLTTQGIEFTNYYEPLWSGCTSGGELVNLSGLAMNCEMNTYSKQKPFNTIGSLLQKDGYFSRAYHNNIYTFYDRHKTHVNLGYEQFIGMKNGMEGGVKEQWPESDVEMMEFTVDDFIDKQPFNVYYMTVSGHCRYNKLGNKMSGKNYDAVAYLDTSEGVK
jgi:lipoteichoic acid synthase